MSKFSEFGSLEENPTPRCLCTFIVDASDSMKGAKIQNLHSAFVSFIQDLKQDDFAKYAVELQIIVASGEKALLTQSITDLQGFKPPSSFLTEGRTPLGDAVMMAIKKTLVRKQQYKDYGVAYYQPWIVILTDGRPTDHYKDAAEELKRLVEARKATSFIIAVETGEKGIEILNEFCAEGQKIHELKDIDSFAGFFKWLSASLSQVSKSLPGTDVADLTLPQTITWESLY